MKTSMVLFHINYYPQKCKTSLVKRLYLPLYCISFLQLYAMAFWVKYNISGESRNCHFFVALLAKKVFKVNRHFF